MHSVDRTVRDWIVVTPRVMVMQSRMEIPADKILLRPAENSLRLRVRRQNISGPVNDKDGIHCLADNSPAELLFVADRYFRRLSCRDIPVRLENDQPSVVFDDHHPAFDG